MSAMTSDDNHIHTVFCEARKLRQQKQTAKEAQQQQAATILQAQTKQWLASHAKRLPLPPLSPKVLAFVREWYYLVDTDGSGELSLDEVAAAMKASGIPYTTRTVEELFNLVDIDGSGIMEWSEFETFVANEIQEGKSFVEGEFVLPSGAGIQFAAMVDVLRRKSRLSAIMKGGNVRELTVARMREEIESHALYELNATLARSTGSRRLPKLKPLLSNPSEFALSRQQTSPQAALHLLQSLSSNAAIPSVQKTDVLPRISCASKSASDAASQLQRKVSYTPETVCSPNAATLQQPAQITSATVGQQTDMLSREAMLLFGPCTHAAQTSQQTTQGAAQQAEKKAVAQLLEAITYEERYHRAGREVLGQHIDFKAVALARKERLKRQRKQQMEQLGYRPLRLQHQTSVKSALAGAMMPDLQHVGRLEPEVSYSSVMSTI